MDHVISRTHQIRDGGTNTFRIVVLGVSTLKVVDYK